MIICIMECRQRHEQAALYSSQLHEAAAQQLNLQSSVERTAASAPAQDADAKGLPCKASPDVIRGAVREQLAKNSGGSHQKHQDCGAPKQQLGAQMHSLPHVPASQHGAAISSRDHSMLDVAAEDKHSVKQTERSCEAVPSIGNLVFHIWQ